MASASTSRDTLAEELHEFDDVESREVLHPATNIYWTGAPAFLHDQFFGPLAFMGSTGVLQIQYMGRPDSIFIADGQGAFDDDDKCSVDARRQIVEYNDESDEAGAGDGTASAEQEDIDDGFLPGEEESDSENGIAYEISADSDDDEILEEAGDDESGVSARTKSTESESEQDDAETTPILGSPKATPIAVLTAMKVSPGMNWRKKTHKSRIREEKMKTTKAATRK